MKLLKKNMEKTELRKTIDNLWNNDTASGDIKFVQECLRKDRNALQKIYSEDPAALLCLYGSEVRRALEASDVSSALPLPESSAVLKSPVVGRHEDSRRQPISVLISFLASHKRPAMSAAALLILLSVFIVYRSFTSHQESAPDKAQHTAAVTSLKKNQIYDKNIRRKAAANADVRGESEFIVAGVRRDSNAFKNAIATNLIADGDKVFHYRMESGTEIIFVTGLD
jgi:hypothetical protein